MNIKTQNFESDFNKQHRDAFVEYIFHFKVWYKNITF